jgi:hypothetical protein
MNQQPGFLFHYLLLLLLLSGSRYQANAQYAFSETFAQPATLSKTGWMVRSPLSTTNQDTVNGWMQPGTGSLHVSFTDMPRGSSDTVTLPVFTTAGANDSLIFDHAHRGDFSDMDSMAIEYSADGGSSFTHLVTYVAGIAPTATSLNTVAATTTWGKFYPADPSEWQHKAIALPAGANRVRFIFYSDAGDELYIDNVMTGKDPAGCPATLFPLNLPANVLLCRGTEHVISPGPFEYNPYLTYQWQQSADNGVSDPWVNVSNTGGINAPDFFMNATQDIWYRLELSCAASPLVSVVSNATHISIDSSYNCYCKNDLGGGCSAWITNVSIPGTSLNNSSACDGAGRNKYSSYAPSASTSDTLYIGQPAVTISVSSEEVQSFTTGKIGFWIDYDKSGTFDSSEFQLITSNLRTGTSSLTFNIPPAALPGYTGMRVRLLETFWVYFDGRAACMPLPNGETEDYLIYLAPAPECAGLPPEGNPAATTTDLCSGEMAVIVAENTVFANGITYEWQESDDDGVNDPWATAAATAGLNTPRLTTAALTDTIYYRLKTSCSNSGSIVYSPSIAINVKPFYMCQCTDGLGGSACNSGTAYISNVTVTGSSLNNTTLCSNNTSSYTRYGFTPSTTDTFRINEMIRLEVTNTVASNQAGVWIDYDRNGIFNNVEYTEITKASVADVASVKQIIIPGYSDTGYTTMRVRTAGLSDFMTETSGCSYIYSGETEDYIIYISGAPECSGAVAGGNAAATLYTKCAGENVSLEVTGASYGTGITYQWQSSADAGNTDPWTDVTTGTGYDNRIFTSAALSDTIYFRLKTTCATTLTEAFSDTVKVAMKPFSECYCRENTGGGSQCIYNEYISRVSIMSRNLNNFSTCHATGNDNYSAFPPAGSATDTVTGGEIINLGVTYEGSRARIAAWIDYDQSGTFDASEYTLIATTTSSGVMNVGTIRIPGNVTGGRTGLRIRTACESCGLGPNDACSNQYTGETEDYVIMINPAPACNAMPVVGTIPSSHIVCAGKPFEIRAAGAVYNTGITYQWEQSADDGVSDPWTGIAGDTSRILNTAAVTDTYLRLKAVCTNTMEVQYTNSMHVIIDSFYNCYNSTVNLGGAGCNPHDMINEVSIERTHFLNNTATSCTNTPLGAISRFPETPSTTATLLTDGVYRIWINSTAYSSIGVWIDIDRNGSFDATEFTLVTPDNNNVIAFADIGIPAGAMHGKTGMRIRTNYTVSSGGSMNGTDAATLFLAGETEDYIVTIGTLEPVSNVTAANIHNNDITVSWTNGNGTGRVVLAKASSTPLTDPVNGTDYLSPNSVYTMGDSTAAGNYIVYNGANDTFVTVTGLDPLTQYDFLVYEYMYTTAGIVYTLPGQTTSGTTLPVKLLSLHAVKQQQDVLVSWSTASEQHNEGFVVERSAGKGSWVKAGNIEGKGESATLNSYTFRDIGAFKDGLPVLYYRLRQKDRDGRETVSGTVSVRNTALHTQVAVYPNPFAETLTITVTSETPGRAHFTLRDMFGKTITETTTDTDKGTTIRTLDQLSHLANGMYFLEVELNGEVQNFKVTRSR